MLDTLEKIVLVVAKNITTDQKFKFEYYSQRIGEYKRNSFLHILVGEGVNKSSYTFANLNLMEI